MNDNQLDDIFGKGTGKNLQSLPTPVSHKDAFELPEEVKKNWRNPVWRAKRRAQRIKEEEADVGYHAPKPQADTGRGKLFNPDMVYKTRRATEMGTLKVDDSMGYEMAMYVAKLYEGNSKLAPIIANDTIRGFKKSLDLMREGNHAAEDAANRETANFLQWLKSYKKIDLASLNENQYKELYVQFLQFKRVRLDLLASEAIELAVGYFTYSIMTNPNINDEIKINIEKDKLLKTKIIKSQVAERGPYMTMDDINIFEWYFNRYGYSVRDRAYFQLDANGNEPTDNRGRPISIIFNEFQAMTGYRFLDVYAYHLKKYKENLRKTDDNDTVEVKQEEEEEIMYVIEE